jgi:O-antigen/teichoic acid export membrane protein
MDDSSSDEGRILANKAVLLTISKVLATAFNIVLFVLLSYTFSREDYGIFRQVWLVNRTLALEIFTFGIPLSIFYFLPRLDDEHRKGFVLQSILILLGAGILVTVAIFVFAKPIAQLFNAPGLAGLLRIFCLFPFLTLPTLAAESVLVSLDRTRSFAVFTIVERVLMFVAAVAAILLYGSVQAVLVAIVAFATVRFFAALSLMWFSLREHQSQKSAVAVREQIEFALPISASGIVDILYVELDKLIITVYFSVTQFARYTNGAFDIPLVGTVASAINSVMMPEFSQAHKEGRISDVVHLWNSTIVRVALLFLPLMGFLFFFATDFITLVFSNKYANSAIIFQIYLTSMIPKIVWYGPILVSLGHSREPLIGSSLALISNVLFSILFVEWLGLVGHAIATVIATYVLAGYFMSRLRTILELRFIDIFPWQEVGQRLLISIGCGLVVAVILRPMDAPNYVRLIAGGSLFYVLVLPLLWYSDLVGKTEVRYISNYAKKVYRITKSYF